MTRGLYRRKKRGRSGKLQDAGAYVIDMRIKQVPELRGIPPRHFKSTEVFPNTRNAATTVHEMKLMVKDLIRTRDASTLRRIQSNKLSLASAYEQWKAGRIHLAQGFEDKKIAKLWREFYERAPISETTKVNRLAIITALINKKQLTEQNVINELIDIVPRIQHHYAHSRQSPAFNTIRIELKQFLKKGLGMDALSPFVRAVLNTLVMKQGKRRAHHPFESLHDCMEFCQQVQKRPTPNAALFARSVLFMCRHGLRPEEFALRRFGVDAETGHLRIRGTKNANAERVVPYIFEFGSDDPPKIDTLNRMFERMATKVRCRGFRRTFAAGCQEARIPNNRIQAYMGHGAQTVTQTYQQVVPTAKVLDQDRKTLDAWVNAELRKAPNRRDESVPLSAFRAMRQMLSPSLGQMQERISKEAAADAASSARRKK